MLAHASGAGEQLVITTGEPKGVESIANCTVPVGATVPDCGATLAVKVTVSPYVGEREEAVNEVLVPFAEGVREISFELTWVPFETLNEIVLLMNPWADAVRVIALVLLLKLTS